MLRKLWGLEMFAEGGGKEGLRGFVGAGICFAFGKIGQLRWLLAVATAGEAALERRTATLGRFAVGIVWGRAAERGGGGRTAHGRHHASTASATAKQRLVQRLPQGLRAENSKMDG